MSNSREPGQVTAQVPPHMISTLTAPAQAVVAASDIPTELLGSSPSISMKPAGAQLAYSGGRSSREPDQVRGQVPTHLISTTTAPTPEVVTATTIPTELVESSNSQRGHGSATQSSAQTGCEAKSAETKPLLESQMSDTMHLHESPGQDDDAADIACTTLPAIYQINGCSLKGCDPSTSNQQGERPCHSDVAHRSTLLEDCTGGLHSTT